MFGPVTDFLCLGGLTLLLLPIVFALPVREFAPAFNAAILALAYVINYPHFAFSYQLFYAGFRRKAFGPDNGPGLRARYVFAGIAVPTALAAFFAGSLVFGDARTLGYGANLMGFLVGWHYVKQGYGMLMVDAALKRRFFDDSEKRVLLINCYALWALAWMLMNVIYGERGLWGIRYAMFEIPPVLLQIGVCVAATTSVAAAGVLFRRWRANGGALPVSGVVAYIVSLYLWLLVMHWNPLWLMVVPALHSLQYLIVVARYHMNRLRDAPDAAEPTRPAILARLFRRRGRQHFAGFVGLGILLGYVGFWGAPELFQATVPYDRAMFGGTAFMFVFWIFINLHHYFLDNVMWRSQNPDMRRYLFAPAR